MRPVWQVLASAESDEAGTLSCDECFAILEYLADVALTEADVQALRTAARRHLARCPDCREHHRQRLHAMEAKLAARRHTPEAR